MTHTLPGEEARARKVLGDVLHESIGYSQDVYGSVRLGGNPTLEARHAIEAMLAFAHQSPSRAEGEGKAYCNKCGFYGDPQEGGFHLRPKDGEPCNYAAATPQTVPANAELSGRECNCAARFYGDDRNAHQSSCAALATPAELPALPSREEIARLLCDASEPRRIAEQEDAPPFTESASHVQEYWLSLADEVAALHPPASVAEVEGLREDAERFRALMRTPRFRMFGAAGVDRETGERTTKAGWLHFGCEAWSVYPGFDADNPDAETIWGRRALRALADAILEEEARAMPSGEKG